MKKYSIYQLENMANAVLLYLQEKQNKDIDIVRLANKIGFNVYQSYSLQSNSFKIKETSIFINATYKPDKQRFLIAKAIAYIILNKNRSEFEINNFASMLLMPREKSVKTWQKHQRINSFANAMKTSIDVASIRLINLNLI